jgi:hypothetical protein
MACLTGFDPEGVARRRALPGASSDARSKAVDFERWATGWLRIAPRTSSQADAHMTTSADATPPRARARTTGVVYLLYFLTAVSDEAFVGRGRVLEFDSVNLIAHAFYIAVTLLFYYMFRPVNRNLSLLAAIFSLVGCANDVLSLFNLAPYKISSLAFFGPYCLLIGYLIFRSTFLPRILGVLMALAGVGWLIVLSRLAGQLSTYFTILGFLAEASLMLWLIVKGVNIPRWKGRASAA